jgi:hypothetical protein
MASRSQRRMGIPGGGMTHRFKLGEMVNYSPAGRRLLAAPGAYSVTGILPENEGQPNIGSSISARTMSASLRRASYRPARQRRTWTANRCEPGAAPARGLRRYRWNDCSETPTIPSERWVMAAWHGQSNEKLLLDEGGRQAAGMGRSSHCDCPQTRKPLSVSGRRKRASRARKRCADLSNSASEQRARLSARMYKILATATGRDRRGPSLDLISI